MCDEPKQLDWAMRIQNAQRRIETDLGRDVPLEELAKVAHASMFHFHRVFRGLTGETVRSYGRRLNLERAAYRLRHDGDDILRVALDAGYNSHEAFTRAFHNQFGMNPSAFRSEKAYGAPSAAGGPTMCDIQVDIRQRGPARIASVRHVGRYQDVSIAWKTLMMWGWTRAIIGKPTCFGLCYDDPGVTDEASIRYEACMEVGRRAKAKGNVALTDNPGGIYAVTLHSGPYDQLGSTYAALCAMIVTQPIDGSLWRLSDPPSLEVYLNDPRSTRPMDLRTEVWMPVVDGR